MERQELLKKIEKLIQKQQLPKAIKKIVDEIYRKYHDTYKEFLSKIKQLVVNPDKKTITNLNKIENDMDKEYQESKDTSYELQQLSYFLKMELLSTNLENTINNILDGKEESEDAVLKAKEKTDLENEKCTQMIVLSVTSEIDSSKKALIMRLSNVRGLKDISDIKPNIDEFSEKIDGIINRTKLESTPKIKEILEAEDIQIKKVVLDLYHQYNKGNKLNNKAEFASSLHAKVNPEKVVERLQKEQRREEGKSLEEDLTI